MNNQQSRSPCIVLSQHRGDGERELKFEVKTEECMREIRPLGFVIEFWLESAVLDISAVSSDMNRYDPSLRCVGASREKKKKKKKSWTRHRRTGSGVPRASPCRTRVRLLWRRVHASQPATHSCTSQQPVKLGFSL